jgi:hypothetical protein
MLSLYQQAYKSCKSGNLPEVMRLLPLIPEINDVAQLMLLTYAKTLDIFKYIVNFYNIHNYYKAAYLNCKSEILAYIKKDSIYTLFDDRTIYKNTFQSDVAEMHKPDIYITHQKTTKDSILRLENIILNNKVIYFRDNTKTLADAKFLESHGAVDYKAGITTTSSIHAAKYLVKKGNVTRINKINNKSPAINRWLHRKGILKWDVNKLLLHSTTLDDVKYYIAQGANNIDEYYYKTLGNLYEYLSGGEQYEILQEQTEYVDTILHVDIMKLIPIIAYLIELGCICDNLQIEVYEYLLYNGYGTVLNHIPELHDFILAEDYIIHRKRQRKLISKYLPYYLCNTADIILEYLPYAK